jgi:hypothetical protein
MIWVFLLALGAEPTMVEERALQKARTVTLSAQLTWLDRFDLRASPGAGLVLTHYFNEWFGIDYLSGFAFYTFDTPTAVAIRQQTGLEIDHGRPYGLATAGARVAFAYGKMLFEGTRTVIHFAPEASVHVGGLITDRGLRFAFDAGLGVRALVAGRLSIVLEYRVLFSIDNGFVVGQMPTLAIGWAF